MRHRPPRRLVFLVIAIVLGVLLGRWLARRPTDPSTTPPPPVAIEDGKSIDFSSGRPVVQDDSAALEQARREMEAVSANITFAPTKTPGPVDQDSITNPPPPPPGSSPDPINH